MNEANRGQHAKDISCTVYISSPSNLLFVGLVDDQDSVLLVHCHYEKKSTIEIRHDPSGRDPP